MINNEIDIFSYFHKVNETIRKKFFTVNHFFNLNKEFILKEDFGFLGIQSESNSNYQNHLRISSKNIIQDLKSNSNKFNLEEYQVELLKLHDEIEGMYGLGLSYFDDIDCNEMTFLFQIAEFQNIPKNTKDKITAFSKLVFKYCEEINLEKVIKDEIKYYFKPNLMNLINDLKSNTEKDLSLLKNTFNSVTSERMFIKQEKVLENMINKIEKELTEFPTTKEKFKFLKEQLKTQSQSIVTNPHNGVVERSPNNVQDRFIKWIEIEIDHLELDSTFESNENEIDRLNKLHFEKFGFDIPFGGNIFQLIKDNINELTNFDERIIRYRQEIHFWTEKKLTDSYLINEPEISRIIDLLKNELDYLKNNLPENKEVKNSDKYPTDKYWFIVGLKFAKGEISLDIKNQNKPTNKIAKDLGNKNYRPFISCTITDNSNGDNKSKNLFYSKEKPQQILDYCKEYSIEVCKEFLDKFDNIKPL